MIKPPRYSISKQFQKYVTEPTKYIPKDLIQIHIEFWPNIFHSFALQILQHSPREKRWSVRLQVAELPDLV
jgi:hypothetical protein